MCTIGKKIRQALASALLFSLSCQISMQEEVASQAKQDEESRPSFPASNVSAHTALAKNNELNVILDFPNKQDQRISDVLCSIKEAEKTRLVFYCNTELAGLGEAEKNKLIENRARITIGVNGIECTIESLNAPVYNSEKIITEWWKTTECNFELEISHFLTSINKNLVTVEFSFQPKERDQ